MQHMARMESQGLQTTRRWAALHLVPVPLGVGDWPKAFPNFELEAAIGFGLRSGFGLQPRTAEQLPIGLGPVPVPPAT